MTQPWTDCPPCPRCRGNCGTRAGGATAAAVARTAGPSWLSCAACGHVWEGDEEAVAQAAKADAAWEAECKAEARRILAQLGGAR